MRTKPLDRLLFAQGGECFFCRKPLPRSEASIEHLVAVTHGGKDNDENCVACCTSLNILFGRMSLKEKLAVILKQKGEFQCPAALAATAEPAPSTSNAPALQASAHASAATALDLVLTELKKRGNARPRTLAALTSTVQSILEHNGFAAKDTREVMGRLRSGSFILVDDKKISAYLLPPKQ